jgi:DivIVA domain-containing protein
MNDDGFRLTPVDIRNQEFRVGFRGYEVAMVEEFRSQVADEMERLLRDRATLEERVFNLREQLKAFREREKAMNEALVSAQQLRHDAEEQAARQREGIVREAKLEADRLVNEAKDQERQVRRDHADAQRQLAGYLTAFRSLLERNLAEIDALESIEHQHPAPIEKRP